MLKNGGGGGAGGGGCGSSEQCNIYINYFNKIKMPTDHTSFFQSWNLKHANIYFSLSKHLVENFFADQASVTLLG